MKELIKKILKVASANGIQVMLGIILGFLLPQYLSIAAYGEYKTYTLIMSYIGFLNLGFADGIYLEYGGKRLSDIKKSQLRSELLFIFLLESILTIIFFFVAIFVKNKLLFLITLSILPYNISTYFKRMYQATDKLERYSRDIIIYTAINFLLCICFIYIFHFKNYIFYCISTISANAIIVLAECIYIHKISFTRYVKFDFIRYKKLFKSGFIIMIGNIIVNLFYGIDRWVVKILFEKNAFAYYSFAVSMLNIVITILQSISLSLFSFFSKKENKDKLIITKDVILVVGAMASCSFFPLKLIVEKILPSYKESLSIIAITMAIFPYMLYISSITINLYKIEKKEKRYLFTMMVVLFLVCSLDFLVARYKRMELIAFATLICYIGWFIYSRIEDHLKVPIHIYEVIYLILNTSVFLITTNVQKMIVTIIYIIFCAVSSVCLLAINVFKGISKNV